MAQKKGIKQASHNAWDVTNQNAVATQGGRAQGSLTFSANFQQLIVG